MTDDPNRPDQGSAQNPQQPPMPPAGYGQPQQPNYGYPQPQNYGYPQPQYGYPVPVNVGTNGFAIASLVCAFLCWPLGLIFGFIARSQIKERHEGGDGLALAGIIISGVFLVLTILYFVLIGVVISNVHIQPIPTPTF